MRLSRDFRSGPSRARSHGTERVGRPATSPSLLPDGSTKALLARCGLLPKPSFGGCSPAVVSFTDTRQFDLASYALALDAGRDHVGCHSSLSMRERIWRMRDPVK